MSTYINQFMEELRKDEDEPSKPPLRPDGGDGAEDEDDERPTKV
jgi:hypothetical protein